MPASPDPRQDPVPVTLGGAYALGRELGGGGMSRVFLAREEALGRDVVVKVLAPALAEGLSAERFAREVRLAAALQDPHIVPVLAAGVTAEGLPYFTMPYVAGESLRMRLQRPAGAGGGPVPREEAVRILRDVAEALEYAHARGIVHRDIKPENVLLSGRNAVVADFGIAKALQASRTQAPGGPADGAHTGALTQLGTSLGTPAYMAPEQAAGDPATDHRTDLYAWGVVAYELLAGRHPFAGRTSPQQLMAAHFAETPAPLPTPPVPPALGALVARCLAKDPADRPASAAAVLAALDAVGASGGTGATAPPASAGPAGRRRRLLAAGAAALVVALVAGGVAAGRGRLGAAFSDPSGGTTAAAAGPPSLAVLPFEHQGDAADAYLTDGLTDEIRGKLAGVRDLVVIARASSNAYRATKDSPREIAEALGVRYLLTGTVRVSGTGAERRVVVRPELVELTASGQPQSRWGQPFDVAGTDVLRLQGDVASQVVAAMEVAVGGADRAKLVAVPTRDPAAYDAYLRAQAAVNWGADADAAALQRAIPLFEDAVRRDPALVDAWAGLASARAVLYADGRGATPALAAATRAAAERTLVLDPRGARGSTARGDYRLLIAHDLVAARADYEAAIRADPGNVPARAYLALLLVQALGRPAEALPHADRGLALDPASAVLWRARAEALGGLGRFAEARVAADRSVALAPGAVRPADVRMRLDLAAGDTAAARATMARLAPDFRTGAALLTLAVDYGWAMDAPATARALATPVEAFGGDRGAWAGSLATLYAQRGDTARARAWADTAVRYLAPAAARANAGWKVLSDLVDAQVLAGRRAQAAETANRGVAGLRAAYGGERGPDYAFDLSYFASGAARAGARDSALAWLREGRGQPGLITPARLRVDPAFASLRGDPRLEALLATPPR